MKSIEKLFWFIVGDIARCSMTNTYGNKSIILRIPQCIHEWLQNTAMKMWLTYSDELFIRIFFLSENLLDVISSFFFYFWTTQFAFQSYPFQIQSCPFEPELPTKISRGLNVGRCPHCKPVRHSLFCTAIIQIIDAIILHNQQTRPKQVHSTTEFDQCSTDWCSTQFITWRIVKKKRIQPSEQMYEL